MYERGSKSNSRGDREPIVNARLVENLKELIRREGNVDFWWSDKHDKTLAEGN